MNKIFIVLMLLLSACNHSVSNIEPEQEDEYQYYVVMCKHPLGHIMRHVISKKAWKDTYGSRNGVFRFRDVEGVYHENSMGCYTNDKVRVNRQGKVENKFNHVI